MKITYKDLIKHNVSEGVKANFIYMLNPNKMGRYDDVPEDLGGFITETIDFEYTFSVQMFILKQPTNHFTELINALWEYNILPFYSLHDTDLSGMGFGNIHLNYKTIHNANLDKSGWFVCRFNFTHLSYISGKHAHFCVCTFAYCEIVKADFEYSIFDGCRVIKTNLKHANLSKANLGICVTENDNIKHYPSTFEYVNLKKATLYKANLAGVKMVKVNLEKADLYGANLVGADLRGAKFNKTNLTNITYSDTTEWPKGFKIPKSAINLDNLH